MLLWILLTTGLVLTAASAWLVLSMSRAERRARRSLYRSLGLAEATVDFLMQRNREVLTELSYVRREAEAAASETLLVAPPLPANSSAIRPNLRLVQPSEDGDMLPGERPAQSAGRPTQH
jgi:hypothetical protein